MAYFCPSPCVIWWHLFWHLPLWRDMFNFPKNKFRKIFFFQNSSKNVILVNPFLPHVVARVMSRIILIALKQSPIAEQHTYFYLFFNSMLCLLRAGTSIIRPTGQLRSGNAKNFPLSLNRTIRLIFKTQNEITSYPSYSRTFTLQIRIGKIGSRWQFSSKNWTLHEQIQYSWVKMKERFYCELGREPVFYWGPKIAYGKMEACHKMPLPTV